MELQIGDSDEAVSRVTLIGMLDMVGVGQVETRFLAATVARGKHTIIDISQMPFIASLGMGLFVGAHRALKRKGAKIVLLNAKPDVEQALLIARLHELLPIAHSEEEALRLLAAAE